MGKVQITVSVGKQLVPVLPKCKSNDKKLNCKKKKNVYFQPKIIKSKEVKKLQLFLIEERLVSQYLLEYIGALMCANLWRVEIRFLYNPVLVKPTKLEA